MNNSLMHARRRSVAARVRGERLELAPDVWREAVAGLTARIAEAEAAPHGWGVASDRRALEVSVACERLADFFLQTGRPCKALRALRDAAFAALDGAAYDHGPVSLPARFLRIRFYGLLDRMAACCAADPRLRGLLEADRELLAEARRLGGDFL